MLFISLIVSKLYIYINTFQFRLNDYQSVMMAVLPLFVCMQFNNNKHFFYCIKFDLLCLTTFASRGATLHRVSEKATQSSATKASRAVLRTAVMSTWHVANTVNSTRHVANTVNSTWHVANTVNSAWHVANRVYCTSHVANTVNRTRHVPNTVNSTWHVANTVYCTSHVANTANISSDTWHC